jgi:hypothetical protein
VVGTWGQLHIRMRCVVSRSDERNHSLISNQEQELLSSASPFCANVCARKNLIACCLTWKNTRRRPSFDLLVCLGCEVSWTLTASLRPTRFRIFSLTIPFVRVCLGLGGRKSSPFQPKASDRGFGKVIAQRCPLHWGLLRARRCRSLEHRSRPSCTCRSHRTYGPTRPLFRVL